jgi:hypothetical protein
MNPLDALSPIQRVGILFAFLALVAAWDLARNRRLATKWREYSFLLAGGGLGALFGVANDLLTSRISPEYFVAGKGLEPGDGFLLRVCELGAYAGFVGGTIAACVLLFANSRSSESPLLGYSDLVAITVRCLVFAAVAGLVAGIAAHLVRAEQFAPDLELALTPETHHRFVVAWAAHAGVYSGLLAGVIGGVLRIRKKRRGSDANVD